MRGTSSQRNAEGQVGGKALRLAVPASARSHTARRSNLLQNVALAGKTARPEASPHGVTPALPPPTAHQRLNGAQCSADAARSSARASTASQEGG